LSRLLGKYTTFEIWSPAKQNWSLNAQEKCSKIMTHNKPHTLITLAGSKGNVISYLLSYSKVPYVQGSSKCLRSNRNRETEILQILEIVPKIKSGKEWKMSYCL
jgi:hypothetical protein